jgi:hypothetical protein
VTPDDDGRDERREGQLAPDPVIEAYKRHVDRTLIREQLRRSPDEPVRHMIAALRFAEALREAGQTQQGDRDRE